MDPTHRQHLINQSTQPPPPPSSSSSSGNSFPIIAVAILGIATTAILLLTYYVFVIKCCLNWRRSDLIRRLTTSRSLLRRYAEPATIHSAPDELLGLEPSAIRAIPIVRFTRSGGSSHECAVCLNEFDEEESLRLLPNCSHIFHVDCIDVWLQSNANCPLCRSNITAQIPFPFPSRNGAVVIEVRGDDGGDRTPGGEAAGSRPDPSPRRRESNKKGKKLHRVTSMGDEFIDSRGRDERLLVQPVRRSFSMDSCCDRRIYVAVQEILQQNPESLRSVGSGEGSSSGGGAGGRVRRSLFSFGHGRSSRKSVLPIHIELS